MLIKTLHYDYRNNLIRKQRDLVNKFKCIPYGPIINNYKQYDVQN